MDYFKRYYLQEDTFMRWSAAYQPAMYTNMETNNYIESWHNQLKTMYLNLKRNRRVDRFIYILVEDVEQDYINNVARISFKIGRMGPEERNRRRRQMAAEEINDEWLEDYCTLLSNEEEENEVTYRLISFTKPETFYEVKLRSQVILTCTCKDFEFHALPCKHMYLLQRANEGFSVVSAVQHERMLQVEEVEVEVEDNMDFGYDHLFDDYDAVEVPTSDTNSDGIQILKDINAVVRSIEDKIEEVDSIRLTDSNINKLEQYKQNLQQFLLKLSEERLPTNSNLQTQRR